ncbi:glycosyltransferase [Plantactinospora sp. WMMB334]|uniref:glycosyltransferase n=1 Tax=Plantactinospora sp. WMMB334 TaxID=3404119 RepID=UPI003B94F86C
MPGRDGPEKYLRWRIVAGDPDGRLRWPLVTRGSRLTRIPGSGPPAEGADMVEVSPAGPAWPRTFVGRMAVVARSVSWLRHLLDHPVSLARVRRITVAVTEWQIPQRGWSGRLGPVPHLLAQRVALPRQDRGRAVVEIELRWSVPLRSVLVAVLPLLTPVRPLPTPGSPEVTAQDVLPGWLGAGPTLTVAAGELPGSNAVRPYDIVFRPDGRTPPVAGDAAGTAYRTRLAVDRFGVPDVRHGELHRPAPGGTDGGTGPAAGEHGDRTGPAADHSVREEGGVLLDAEYAVPIGRYGPFGADAPRAELTFSAGPDGGGWRIRGPEPLDRSGRLDRPWLDERTWAALAGIGVLDCPSVPGRRPRAEAALLLHLALAGVLVRAPGLPPACTAHLSDEVVELLRAPLPDRPVTGPDPDLEWEVRAVRQRRAALRRHARGFALPRLAAATFPGLGALPSVSVLLVTRRLEHVLDAVRAVAAQTYPELEIVLCLHGVGLPAGLRRRLAGYGRPVEVVEVPAGRSFGEALVAATARARGTLVTKFDDDDTYGPEHVWDLVLARHHSGATMVGKAAEFVHLGALDITVRRDAGAPESFAPIVAGGTILIGRGDLAEVGGWRPVPRSVDRGLIDRVRRAGGLVYRTHPLGYVYRRRPAGHTWDPGLEYFLRDGGAQWTGLPRHAEFGTSGPAATSTARRIPRPHPVR